MDFLARITIYISLGMGICIFTMFTLFAVPNLMDRYQNIWEDYQGSLEPELEGKWYSGEDNYPEQIPFSDNCTYSMKKHLLEYSGIAHSSDGNFDINLVGLPSGMNSDDFQRCMDETSFTMSRMSMVTSTNPHVEEWQR